MKKNRTKKIIIAIIILGIAILLFKNNKNAGEEFQDEIIFFKSFASKQENKNYPTYNFKVTYKNTKLRNIQLLETINKETLIQNKIAPGTKGAFEINLETQEKIGYQINFESKNNKPKNLKFKIEGKDRKYEKLEDMQEELKGEINKTKSIVILWEWEYEKNSKNDIQDTKDGINIKEYNFTIYAIGKSI